VLFYSNSPDGFDGDLPSPKLHNTLNSETCFLSKKEIIIMKVKITFLVFVNLLFFLLPCFFAVYVNAQPQTLYFDNQGTYRTARFQQAGVSVTPEVNLPLLGLLNLNGVGVVGGSSDTTLDPGESLLFRFSSPATAVSYFVGWAFNGDGDLSLGEASVEGYGADGTLLGVAAIAESGPQDISGLFGNTPLSAFRVHTRDNDRQRISAVSFNHLQLIEVGPSGYPCTSIQAAINAALPGDTVLVHDGTYVENINFLGKAITVRSANGPASTIIDGSSSGIVVTFTTGEGSGSVLEGFTITNANAPGDWGGGIRCYSSSPTITNCIITGNSSYAGGGISCESGSSPTITNCTISGNTAFLGGGIFCKSGSSPTITNCIISGNTGAAHSGGIGCDSGCSPIITNCIISGNTAGDGGGIYSYLSSPTIINCTISGNTATNGNGGGIRCQQGTALVGNSILWGDAPNEIYLDAGDSITVTYSDVDQEGYASNNGNIRQNPLFVNPANGNFRLQPTSPCIDAATSDGAPLTDMKSIPRFDAPGVPNTGGGTYPYYDMGALEYVFWTSIPGSILSGPALAWNEGIQKIQMVVRGGGDSIWSTLLNADGTQDGSWVQIPGAILSTPALAWNPNYPGGPRMQMVVRGGGDSIWRATFNSSGTFMNDWVQIPGAILSTPALAWNPSAGKMQMVVRGGGDSIWAILLNADGTQDGGWVQIPGAIFSTPALAWNPNYPGGGRMQMVVRGGGDSIWAASFNSSGVFNSDWTFIPGSIPSSPALAWDGGTQKMQMVVRGGGDTIWAATFGSNGTFNNDWTQIPGSTPSTPGIAYLRSGCMFIVVQGSDNSIWKMPY
jgi:hypothetical protein